MKRSIPILLAALLMAMPVVAAEPIKVTADNFIIEQGSNSATFSGNVVITRTGLTLRADKVVIAYGAGGESDIDSLVATGNVRIKTPSQEATGRQATFNPDTQILRLSEDVTVVNGQGKMSGPELTIDLANSTSSFKGGKGGRVTGVFTPQ